MFMVFDRIVGGARDAARIGLHGQFEYGAQKSVAAIVKPGYRVGMNRVPTEREMRNAFYRSDAEYDGIFFVAVRTTGVFCRPSCTARKPKPRNIEFFFAARQALFAGYRPCRRCHPLETNGAAPDWVIALLARVESQPSQRLTATDLRRVGVDPTRARRYFLKHHGMTFNAYQRARRLGMALLQIRQGKGVTDVAIGSGYESESGFRDAFRKKFGKAPGKSRAEECIVTRMIESPVGPLLAGATSKAVCLLEFTDRRGLEKQIERAKKRFKCPVVPGKNQHLDLLARELAAYFAGKLTRFTVPLDFPGTPFQMKTWRGLLRIPYGKTWSYEELAEKVGHDGAQRAVGTANGANRIAIVIPCHRVVNKGGKLGGYGGGLWRKQFLLDLERGQSTLK